MFLARATVVTIITTLVLLAVQAPVLAGVGVMASLILGVLTLANLAEEKQQERFREEAKREFHLRKR
jgi:ABC-type bacteriocin/lantibiotic exporter with double-glycine peptidase domain